MLSKLVVTVKGILTENVVRVCDVFDILKLHSSACKECLILSGWRSLVTWKYCPTLRHLNVIFPHAETRMRPWEVSRSQHRPPARCKPVHLLG